MDYMDIEVENIEERLLSYIGVIMAVDGDDKVKDKGGGTH